MNVSLIVFMIITIILLFTAMVLSAMASADAKRSVADCQEGCSKWAMWSALVTGLAVAIIGVVLVMYIYISRKKYLSTTLEGVLPKLSPDRGNNNNEQPPLPDLGGMNDEEYISESYWDE